MTYPSARIRALRAKLGRPEWAPLAGARPGIVYNPEHRPEGTRDRLRWIERASRGLRVAIENATEEVHGRRCTGYYVDSFQSDATHGAVLQLPARNGTPRYVPAVLDPWNEDCYLADFRSVTDELADAARWADRMAERFAEDCREDHARHMAAYDIEDARDTIAACRQKLRALTAELRASHMTCGPAVRAALLESIRATRRESHEAWKTIEARQSDFWTAVGY